MTNVNDKNDMTNGLLQYQPIVSVHLLNRCRSLLNTTPVTLSIITSERSSAVRGNEYPKKLTPSIGAALPRLRPFSVCKRCLSPSYPLWSRHRLANQTHSSSLRRAGGVRRGGNKIKARKVEVKCSHRKRLISISSYSPGLTLHLLSSLPFACLYMKLQQHVDFPYFNV